MFIIGRYKWTDVRRAVESDIDAVVGDVDDDEGVNLDESAFKTNLKVLIILGRY